MVDQILLLAHPAMLVLWITAAALLFVRSLAVFTDEAWNVDYHYPLLGLPQEETSFFHQPNPSSRASLIYTLSDEGVLGAVNPRDGSIVWRQVLHGGLGGYNASFLRAGEGQDVVVSGAGNRIAAWSAADGREAWSLSVQGSLEDVEILALGDGKDVAGAKDAIALSSGPHAAVQRVDGSDGVVKWQYTLDGSDTPF